MATNSSHQYNWTNRYATLMALRHDLSDPTLNPGWTDTESDALYIKKLDKGGYQLYMWNDGDATLIREAIRDFFDL